METLTEQLYCSRSEKATVFLWYDNASLAHVSYLQYKFCQNVSGRYRACTKFFATTDAFVASYC